MLTKELKKVEADISSIEKKLANKDFIMRAPQEIVEVQQTRLDAAQISSQKLKQALERLSL